MKATLTYEGKTVEIEIAEEEARKIFGEPKTGWERECEGSYYSIRDNGNLENLDDEGGRDDEELYTCGNYFANEQLANDQARAISLWLRIKRWAAEHCEPVAWGPVAGIWWYKYGIKWSKEIDGSYEILPAIQDSTRQFGNVYFDTEEHAEQCIEEFRDDLLWCFTECRDRMDG